MKIKSVKISGFRSIKNEIEFNPSNICAIIGANNVGKSNILSAINKVLGKDWVTVNSFDDSDVHNNDFDTDIKIEIEFDPPLEHHQYKGIDPVLIPKISFNYTRYKIGEEKGHRRLEKKCLTAENKPVHALKNKPKIGEQRQYMPLTTIPQDIQESLPVIYISAERSLKNQLPSARYSILGNLLKDIDTDFSDVSNKIKITHVGGAVTEISRKEAFEMFIKKALNMLKTEEFTKLEKAIKDNALHQLGFDPVVDSDKLDIYFNPLTSIEFYKSLEIYVKENDHQQNATDLGQGFQNAIVIAIIQAFEERKKQGAVFLIEEPELYLHPQMQRSLYKTLREIGKTNQILYITHSPHFVTIPEYSEILLVRKNEEGTFVKHSSLIPKPRLTEKFRKELDPERNELFFAKKILIVEGDTEKLAFPEYAKRMNIDLDKNGVSIIEVGGKRSIMDFVDLALSFDIPVGFVYDTDSSDFNGKREEEIEYNKQLEAYTSKGVSIWEFDKKYEDELRKFYGEEIYDKMCQKYEKTSKAIKARLFACDIEFNIPEFIKPIIAWMG